MVKQIYEDPNMLALPRNEHPLQLLLTNLLSIIVSLWCSTYISLFYEAMKSYHPFARALEQYQLSLSTTGKPPNHSLVLFTHGLAVVPDQSLVLSCGTSDFADIF